MIDDYQLFVGLYWVDFCEFGNQIRYLSGNMI